MQGPDAPKPAALPEGQVLPSGMSLATVGRALLQQTRSSVQEAAERIRGLVDLPGDVYRAVTGIPDERGLREYLAAASPALLSLAVPVVRALANSGGASRKMQYAQPILLGKLFGTHDYIQDRTEVLLAIPKLPKALVDEARGLADYLVNNQNLISTAVRTLPCPQSIAGLGTIEFWKATADEEWTHLTERVDGRYETIAKTPERYQRDLPLFRATYVLTYFTLAKLDPVASRLAKYTPGAIRAYQKWSGQKELIGRIAERMLAAGVEIESPQAIDELHHHPDDTVPSAPAHLGAATIIAQPSLALGTAPSAPAEVRLDLPPTRPPAKTVLQFSHSTLTALPPLDGGAAKLPTASDLASAPMAPPSSQLTWHNRGLGPDLEPPMAGEMDTAPFLPAGESAFAPSSSLGLPGDVGLSSGGELSSGGDLASPKPPWG